ncbi:ArsR/SmtB family transcription factor [Kitasatospora sp. NPDC059795]|uniref:ArsR/SmtB family transcription factor n=1 Tax=unclassified Kitasatospora TaxID=2633591 RepID=UPI000B0BE91D|nr:metalloregulator ArsR/SmtB family transcription factor [Kitasatospora sp. CB01950]
MVMSAVGDVNGAVDVLKAVADPLRMRILTLLAREALCTSHLVEETGAKQTNLSNHLKILREAGLVDTEPCGRFTYYKLRPDALESLAGLLGDLAATARATACADTKRSCP